MRVLYGGSFNPPTVAHEQIIDYLAKCNKIDEVIIVPNSDNYHYGNKNLIPLRNRLEMLKLITRDLKKIKIIEFPSSQKFNGIIEILELLKNPAYVIGDDCLFDLKNWIRSDELLANNSFIVFPRIYEAKVLISLIKDDPFLSKYLDHFTIIPDFQPNNISSTAFRNGNNEKMVSETIKKYLADNKLI